MTGLLGGGHAIYFDGEESWNLDCFVDVPSGDGAPPVELRVPFGEELVHYAVGPGRAPSRGSHTGSASSTGATAACPGRRLVEPALRLARDGVTMPAAHAACLAMLGPVFTMQPDGERIYAPAGRLLEAGETLEQPGLATALELLAVEGADSVYAGSIAELLDGGRGRARDGRRPRRATRRAGRRRPRSSGSGAACSRAGGLSGVPETLERLPRLRDLDSSARVHALLGRSPRRRGGRAHDESRHRGRGGRRLRADLEPRPRHGRLPPRARRAAQQHARRGRPRPGAASGRESGWGA